MPGRQHADAFLSDIESLSGIASRRRDAQHDASRAPNTKRRRIEGLNARYDRMLEAVDVVHRSSASVNPPRRIRRQSAMSSISGSSSTTSYDLPKTPMDAYSERHESTLGKSFSLAEAPQSFSSTARTKSFDGTEKLLAQREPVPQWFRETISTLDKNHPLHTMVPLPFALPGQAKNARSLMLPTTDARSNAPDDDIFAFRPPPTPPLLTNMSPPTLPHNFATYLDTNSAHFLQSLAVTDRPAPMGGATVDNPQPPPSAPPIPMYPGIDAFDVVISQQGPEEVPLSPVMLAGEDDVPLVLPFSKPGPFAPITLTPSGNAYTRIQEAMSPLAWSYGHATGHFPDEKSDPEQFSLSDILKSSSSSSSSVSSTEDRPSRLGFSTDVKVPTSKSQDTMSQQRIPARASSKPDSSSMYSNWFLPTATPKHEDRLNTPPIAPFKVYFDDPVEDPSDPSSDPLEKPDYELELDYDSLDFRWQKFERSGLPLDTDLPNTSQNFWTRQAADPHDEIPTDTNAMQFTVPRTPERAKQHMTSSNAQEGDLGCDDEGSSELHMDDSDASWSLPARTVKTTKYQRSNYAPTGIDTREEGACQQPGSRERIKAFAPAPGIYISPLRDKVVDSDAASQTHLRLGEGIRAVSEVHGHATVKMAATAPDRPEGRERERPAHSAVLASTSHRGKAGQRKDDEIESVEDPSESPHSERSNDSIESWTDVAS